jgi:hypothetical protein
VASDMMPYPDIVAGEPMGEPILLDSELDV